jgi:D-alanine-D-alanine ligase
VPVTKAVVVTRNDWHARREEIQREILDALPLPLFAKPANGGSSVGVAKVHTAAELAGAIDGALRYEDLILVEEGIDAREIECAILGGDVPRASIPGEIIPGHEFYDYEDKYVDSGSKAIIPATLSAGTIEEVRRLALLAATTLRVEEMARVDFFVERGTDRVFLNEVNTLPGFTSISMYPKLWEASGIPLALLLTELVARAIARFRRSRELRASFVPPVALG